MKLQTVLAIALAAVGVQAAVLIKEGKPQAAI